VQKINDAIDPGCRGHFINGCQVGAFDPGRSSYFVKEACTVGPQKQPLCKLKNGSELYSFVVKGLLESSGLENTILAH